ncbi:MAG: hypothetical protein R3178_09055, partial [Rhodothermales bacterium]|nr:hypothetical protein [Rhodothermales bacterium]
VAPLILVGVGACDSVGEDREDPVFEAVEEATLEEQILGLWERDIGQTTVGWLFKEGGVFQLGVPRPFFPVVGNWTLRGDSLSVTDPGCLDRGLYTVEIKDGELTPTVIDDSCDGRRSTLEGAWTRFVYGQ